jgi:hypothetical protein
LVIVGGIFVVEALSVILQVGSFKLTKKRIFKIAPLHHHFQFLGWPESKVIVRFWIVAGLLALLTLMTLKIRSPDSFFMRNIDYFKHKKVIVVGCARSGLACAQLLSGLGAEVSVTDSSDTPAVRQNLALLKEKNIRVESGRHTPEFIVGGDLIVISPGVANTSLPVTWAREHTIPVISEIEAAGWYARRTLSPLPAQAEDDVTPNRESAEASESGSSCAGHPRPLAEVAKWGPAILYH